MLTPAISVLSAVEGLRLVAPVFDGLVVPATVAILFGLFWVQSRGTAHVARFFAPIMGIWFAALALGGLLHIIDDPRVFQAVNPVYGIRFMYSHGLIGLTVLGLVFLAVTGAEALYTDLGHFGRGPIRTAWIAFVFPVLSLNYLGQGAMVLATPEAAAQPFFLMAPDAVRPALVGLATLATIIASQAVISGAF